MPKRKLTKDEKNLTSRGPDTDEKGNSGYKVGNCKPPKEHQFKPGKSGNPKGRPQGAKNKTISLETIDKIRTEEAHRKIELNGESLTMMQLADRALWAKAARGDHRAYEVANQVLVAASLRQDAAWEGRFKTFADYKVRWMQELQARKEGTSQHTQEPLPHPDHIFINEERQLTLIAGPTTPVEKEVWDKIHAEINRLRDAIRVAYDEAQSHSDPDLTAGLLVDSLSLRWTIAMHATVLAIRWHRMPDEVLIDGEEDYMHPAIYKALDDCSFNPHKLDLSPLLEAQSADQGESYIFEETEYFKHNGYRKLPPALAVRIKSRLATQERVTHPT